MSGNFAVLAQPSSMTVKGLGALGGRNEATRSASRRINSCELLP